jgi:tetratricopeptide (TPR) repeat protein
MKLEKIGEVLTGSFLQIGHRYLTSKRAAGTLVAQAACVLFVLTSFGSGSAKAGSKERAREAASKMTFQQACTGVLDSVRHHPGLGTPWQIRQVSGGFAIWGEDGWTRKNPILVKSGNIKGDGLESDHKFVLLRFKEGGPPHVKLWFDSEDAAFQFASAFDWFLIHPDDPAAEHLGYGLSDEQAASWRSLTAKPAMPEEARAHKVLAENAVQEKNLDKAIDEYDAALQIFATWPEGQFNLAVICGETGDYDCAVEHMQDYVELVPDAPDVQAAKDKIIIWKDKLGATLTAAQAEPTQTEDQIQAKKVKKK